MKKYFLCKCDKDNYCNPKNVVQLTNEDLKAIWYSITNTCEAFGDKLPNVVNKIRKVL